MSETVRIVEVGPRDGLQNGKTPIGVADRSAFIRALLAAGLSTIEVGAFVRQVCERSTLKPWR